jgi:UDP-N-acetylmuramate--alanine ligase
VRTHFVGIGGIGMSGLARVLAARGAAVDGCDRAEGPALDGLRALGIPCAAPHDPVHLAGVDRVVVSSAIDVAEPELVRARDLGLPLLHRSEVLAEILAAHRRRVVVTGAHGKTTTTGMIAYALARLGHAPTFLVGGDVPQLGGNAGAGGEDVCVAEGDESDRSVARLPADVAVVLNVDLDHLDHYASVADVVDLLASWTARLPADGLLVAGDGVELPTDAAVERFGLGPGEGLRALDAESGPDGVAFTPSSGGRAVLAVHGVHNAANACAAALVLRRLGVRLDDAFAALATFTGTGRRFETVGERDGVRVVDDYAHHPAELAATLAAGRAQRPARLVVYFQPHMPWRTRAFAAAFADALAAADVAVVGETYVARGAPDPGATARAIVERLRAAAPDVEATFVADEEEAVGALRARLRRGDLVLCCGAGPVDRVARRLVAG